MISQTSVFAAAGDIDSDNNISKEDVNLFRSFLTGDESAADIDLTLADCNGDSKADVLDYILLKDMVLKSAQKQDQTYIHLEGKTITIDGNNAVADENKKIVTITASGSYSIDGTLEDGQICVNIPDTEADPGTVKLFFNGVNITGVSEAPLYIANAENTSVNLARDTVNYLYDGPEYTQTEAVVYAKDDITFKGEGTLEIHADAHNAVHCSNDLKINGCRMNIETLTGDALRGKNSVEIKSGEINIDSKSDSIKSTKGEVNISGGTISVKSGADAVQAETSINISGGTLTACGDRGLTGVKDINITGGTVLATATDNQSGVFSSVTIPSMLLEYSEECPKNNAVIIKNTDGNILYDQNTLKKFSYAFIASDSLGTDVEYILFTGDLQTHQTDSDIFTAGLPASYTGLINK